MAFEHLYDNHTIQPNPLNMNFFLFIFSRLYLILCLPQNTEPPIMNTLSSSLLTYCTTLFAAMASSALEAVAGATAYNSKTGVDQARQVCVVEVEWWIFGCTGRVWSEAWSRV